MAIKDKYFDPNWYYYKVITLCVLICIDILFNSFTQYYNFDNKYTWIAFQTNCKRDNRDLGYLLIGLQIGLQVLMIFNLLSFFSQTFSFKQGMLGAICGKFVPTFVVVFLYPVVFLCERFIRASYLTKFDENDQNPTNTNIEIWKEIYYLIFYILKYICAFLFYIFSMNTSFELGKAKYYQIDMSLAYPY